MHEDEHLNPYEISRHQLDRAIGYLPDLKHGLVEFLKCPGRTVTLCFPVEMDDGSVRIKEPPGPERAVALLRAEGHHVVRRGKKWVLT